MNWTLVLIVNKQAESLGHFRGYVMAKAGREGKKLTQYKHIEILICNCEKYC